MGRWAQARIRGGGPGGTAALSISITTAQITATDEATLTYNNSISAPAFNLTDFTSNLSGQHPTAIANDDPNVLILTFVLAIVLDTSITYTGTVANIVTPQTKAYT